MIHFYVSTIRAFGSLVPIDTYMGFKKIRTHDGFLASQDFYTEENGEFVDWEYQVNISDKDVYRVYSDDAGTNEEKFYAKMSIVDSNANVILIDSEDVACWEKSYIAPGIPGME